MSKIVNFTDLNAWKEGHCLVLEIYKLVNTFPSREKFILTSQLLRAVISITSNIAEGFGRHGRREKVQFYYLAQGSLTETQNQLIIARDVGYLDSVHFAKIWNITITTQKLISGLIRSIKLD